MGRDVIFIEVRLGRTLNDCKLEESSFVYSSWCVAVPAQIATEGTKRKRTRAGKHRHVLGSRLTD